MHLIGEDFAVACQPSGGIFEKDKVMGGNRTFNLLRVCCQF